MSFEAFWYSIRGRNVLENVIIIIITWDVGWKIISEGKKDEFCHSSRQNHASISSTRCYIPEECNFYYHCTSHTVQNSTHLAPAIQITSITPHMQCMNQWNFRFPWWWKLRKIYLFGRGVATHNSSDRNQCPGGACCLHVQFNSMQSWARGKLHLESTGTRWELTVALLFQTETGFSKTEIWAQYLHWL